MPTRQPVRILIAAMGGEGGGVLAGWITQAALALGLQVQRTSIPGVAQRTGATTYYLEILGGAAGSRPVLALSPAPGQVDVVLATELLEAARTVQAGFVTPDRTLLVASTHRVFTIGEKVAMGDGRLDAERLRGLAERFARTAVLDDFAAVADSAKGQLNAVLLGALAAQHALPMDADGFRAAVRADGKAVDANLRAFDAGLAAALPLPLAGEGRGEGAGHEPSPHPVRSADSTSPASGRGDPAAIAAEGVRRLLDYQDEDYGHLYLDRLERFARLADDEAFLAALARHLAVRMSVEDTIRVAQLKLRSARLERVRGEAKAARGDVVHVTEYLKPGPEEILGVLPARIARPLLALCARRGWMERAVSMRVRTTTLSGFLRLRMLAGLRRWRPRSLRYAQEQAWIERWLGLVERALAVDAGAARELVETAGLVKGYGDTYKRGMASWTRIVDEVAEPMLRGELDAGMLADAVVQCRLAALADPSGARLEAVIASVRAVGAEQPRLAAE
jgi:indolepyruvate ferredoxin oxidoreductase beta subunit